MRPLNFDELYQQHRESVLRLALRMLRLWMWVRSDNAVLTQDFMDDRILKGGSDWKKVEVVLDVPKGAQTVTYGVRLWGPGEVWVAGMEILPVGKDVSVTDPSIRAPRLPLEPVNLF